MIATLCEHLWQSTLFAGAAWLLTLALRNHRASVRHWVWLAASVKFLVPFSVLMMLGEAIDLEPAAPTRQAVASAIAIFAPLSTSEAGAALDQPSAMNVWTVLVCCWIVGSVALTLRWLGAWLQTQAVLRAATPLDLDAPIPVKTSALPVEPGVIGILNPVVLLPSGVMERFSSEQLHAILAHELCHVERRDNLKASVHMLVEVLLWFHPLVWWIGARLLKERERACDESVLEAGHEPGHYAEGVLNVCRFFHRSALLGAAASGGNLRQRIEGILSARRPADLTPAQRILLGSLALLTVTAPIAAGAVTATKQHDAAPAPYTEVLMLTASGGGGGDGPRVHLVSGSLHDLVVLAYGVDGSQVRIDARWLDSRLYRLEVAASVDPSAYRALLTQLLADRFNLEIYINRRCQQPCGRNAQSSDAAVAAPPWIEHPQAAPVRF